MDRVNINNSRITFLKKISLAFVSVFGLGIAGFKFQKLLMDSGRGFKTLSEKEANEIIRNLNSPKPMQLKPEPPPYEQQP